MQLPGFPESASSRDYSVFANMSTNCILISSCVVLLALAIAVPWFQLGMIVIPGQFVDITPPSILFLGDGYDRVGCILFDAPSTLKSPSLESFIQALIAEEDQNLNGLAVYSNLTSACQPPAGVSKAKIQVHIIALVTLVNEAVCSLQDLAIKTQNAGYSVLIYFADGLQVTYVPTEEKILIPVLSAKNGRECFSIANETEVSVDGHFLTAADRTNVVIRQFSDELRKMKSYLCRLMYWFLVGPTITIVWLICAKKLCCMSGGQQVNQGQAVGSETVVESEIRNMVEGEFRTEHVHLHSVAGASARNQQENDGERRPLLTSVNDDYTRQPRGARGIVSCIRKICNIVAVGFCYLILIIAALPVGISIGGLSFFRFNSENYVVRCGFQTLIPDATSFWSPFQVICFSLYSWFACKTTWTIPTNFSKLIRSEWFSSNIYLLVLGIVVPYSATEPYFAICSATYNTVCTVSNVLFIIMLNKHNFVTPYVFYISVCVICANIESDIVAVFYYALNSEGSLNDLKLTALRAAAIGLTLTVSLGTCIHIIRKLTKPRESLFEGLSEK